MTVAMSFVAPISSVTPRSFSLYAVSSEGQQYHSPSPSMSLGQHKRLCATPMYGTRLWSGIGRVGCQIVTACALIKCAGRCRRVFKSRRVKRRQATRSRMAVSRDTQENVPSIVPLEQQQRTKVLKEHEFPLCKAALGIPIQTGPRVPVWVFRQAGRHLPEYNAYKRERGKNFLELLQDPDDVAEVTLQPLRRYPVDAAILFSDILVVAEALGIRIDMPGGRGIHVPEPLRSPDDLKRLPSATEVAAAAFVETRLAHIFEAIHRILAKMRAEGFGNIPLIGFSAAPWTLFFYMVGGSSLKLTGVGERWIAEHESASKELFSVLTSVIIEYLSAQVRAGCHVLQVFEAMGEHITPLHFRQWALPALAKIAKELRHRHPDVPLMVFPRGASYALPDLQSAGYDVITVDTGTNLGDAAESLRAEATRVGGRIATLQGNFDPKWLRPSEGSSVAVVRREVQTMLTSMGSTGPNLIANLGEGLQGTECPQLVSAFVEAVHEFSAPRRS